MQTYHTTLSCHIPIRYVSIISDLTEWGELSYLLLKKNDLIKKIAKQEDIDVAMVRKVVKAAEMIIFDHLSSATPSEKMVVKPLDGLSITGSYSRGREINGFAHFISADRIKAKPAITDYYNEKLNMR